MSQPIEGDCSRCHVHSPGVKLFLLQPYPSYERGNAGKIPASLPDVVDYMVCKNCLTDEEIARLLAPVAIFVLSHAFIYTRPPSFISKSASHVKAALVLRAGIETLEDRRTREKALEALG